MMRILLLICILCLLECFIQSSLASIDLQLKFSNKRGRGRPSDVEGEDDETEELETADGDDKKPASKYTNATEDIEACIQCSAPCRGYCCESPPYRYCIYYNGRCYCGR